MKKMRVSHEVPISLLEKSRRFNDYDYCLCHLYSEREDYRAFYKESVKKNRHVLLDNSIFELGVSFDPDKYAEIITDLRPDEYIVPDVLEDADATIEQYESWKKNFKDLPGSTIGVVQGKTYKDIKKCMRYMINNADRIAVSFDYSFYKTIGTGSTDVELFATGRGKLFEMLDNDLLLPYNKRYHLLGCALPQEYILANEYTHVKKMFTSVDTSNPIVHGLQGIRYDGINGLKEKHRTKLADLIDAVPTKEQLDDIMYNVTEFRNIMDASNYGPK